MPWPPTLETRILAPGVGLLGPHFQSSLPLQAPRAMTGPLPASALASPCSLSSSNTIAPLRLPLFQHSVSADLASCSPSGPSVYQRGAICVTAAKAKKVKYPRGGAKPREAKAEAEEEVRAEAGEGAEDEESGAGRAEPAGAVAPAAEKQRKEADRLSVKASDPVDGKIQVQVQVPGMTTQAVYNKTLAELARTCPPVPGARMSKGGKSTKVEPAVILRLVGKGRVTGFVVREVVNSTLATFVEERGLNAEKEAKTLQSAEDLAAVFIPGKPFAFDAEITLMDGPAESPVEGSADGATTPQAVAADA